MLFRPRREMYFSRRLMGWVFLVCGLLLTTVHYLAGLPLLLLAGIFLYYAPRWDLRIEVGVETLRFSENLIDAESMELRFQDLAEIRRVSELVDRRGILNSSHEYLPFLEFECRSGKVWRMHDIFPEALDEELRRVAAAAGVQVKDLGN